MIATQTLKSKHPAAIRKAVGSRSDKKTLLFVQGNPTGIAYTEIP